MQNYRDFAQKNNIILLDSGACQCCGAQTSRGIHECLELFSLGFNYIDYSKPENYIYRFLSVDAHTLQHPEVHGRWNNHFHLTRLHLIITHHIMWSYQLSPLLSNHLKSYKKAYPKAFLTPPQMQKRGNYTTTDVLYHSSNEESCKHYIKKWANLVYKSWDLHHNVVDKIAISFLKTHKNIRTYKV